MTNKMNQEFFLKITNKVDRMWYIARKPCQNDKVYLNVNNF